MSLPEKPFAVVLKNARKNNNLTQAQLAEILDISLSYVKDLERSRNNPSYEMFERIIRYFNLSADDVIYFVKEPEMHTRKKIEQLLLRCSEKQLRVILATTESLLSMDKND
ncbi:MAG: helix-turn-helix transcriptional regulator [Lachnospiraceae bacterium]|nr:helix-turn-helix transcriptional regulator [Lachnospiraceae bacterium]